MKTTKITKDDQEHSYIVMENCPAGDLFTLLLKNSGGIEDVNLRKHLFAQILKSV